MGHSQRHTGCGSGGRLASNSFRIRSDSEKGTPILKKKKNQKKVFSEKDNDCDISGKAKITNKAYAKSFDSVHHFKDEKPVVNNEGSSCRGVIPPPIINQSKDASSNDLFYLQPEVEFTSYEKASVISNKDELCSGILNRPKPLRIEDDPLCADIATCDTLFLDIGTKETPQLKAARNLKGRLKKKKKDLLQLEIKEASEADKERDALRGDDDYNGNEISRQMLSTTSQNEPKPKKKIKIVIGAKKNKAKSKKKVLGEID